METFHIYWAICAVVAIIGWTRVGERDLLVLLALLVTAPVCVPVSFAISARRKINKPEEKIGK